MVCDDMDKALLRLNIIFLMKRDHSVGDTTIPIPANKNIPNNKNISFYDAGSTWRDFLKSNKKALITIYTEDCPNCQYTRQPLAEVAKEIFDQDVRFTQF